MSRGRSYLTLPPHDHPCLPQQSSRPLQPLQFQPLLIQPLQFLPFQQPVALFCKSRHLILVHHQQARKARLYPPAQPPAPTRHHRQPVLLQPLQLLLPHLRQAIQLRFETSLLHTLPRADLMYPQHTVYTPSRHRSSRSTPPINTSPPFLLRFLAVFESQAFNLQPSSASTRVTLQLHLPSHLESFHYKLSHELCTNAVQIHLDSHAANIVILPTSHTYSPFNLTNASLAPGAYTLGILAQTWYEALVRGLIALPSLSATAPKSQWFH